MNMTKVTLVCICKDTITYNTSRFISHYYAGLMILAIYLGGNKRNNN